MNLITLNDREFVKVLQDTRATSDPDYVELELRLVQEGRLFVKGIKPAHRSRLYYAFPRNVHVLKYQDGFIVYLDKSRNKVLANPVK